MAANGVVVVFGVDVPKTPVGTAVFTVNPGTGFAGAVAGFAVAGLDRAGVGEGAATALIIVVAVGAVGLPLAVAGPVSFTGATGLTTVGAGPAVLDGPGLTWAAGGVAVGTVGGAARTGRAVVTASKTQKKERGITCPASMAMMLTYRRSSGFLARRQIELGGSQVANGLRGDLEAARQNEQTLGNALAQ